MKTIHGKKMQAISITYGEVTETRTGMNQNGNNLREGFTYDELKKAKKWFKERGFNAKLFHLNKALAGVDLDGKDAPDSYVLHVENGAKCFCDPDNMYKEQVKLTPDKTYFDGRRKKVLNMRARYNLTFGEEAVEPDIDNKVGKQVAFEDVPETEKIRIGLEEAFGEKAAGLRAEGNYYFEPKKCGIGKHGDRERGIVICASLGEPMLMHFEWFYRCKPRGKKVEFPKNHGDLYAMSAHAVGQNWMKSSTWQLRHAVGHDRNSRYLK